MLLSLAESVRDWLTTFLAVGGGLLLTLLILLVAQRLVREARFARRQALQARYRPMLDAALAGDDEVGTLPGTLPTRHHGVAAELLLSTLRVVRGRQATRAAAIADTLQLTARWRRDLRARRWWLRSEAALALGLLRDRQSVRDLMALLDDEHDQVRAATIDALGQIGDPLAVPALLERLRSPIRHERARVTQALRAFGARASDPLIEYGQSYPGYRTVVAEVLSQIGGTTTAATLLDWTTAHDPAVRAASWTALATTGIDDRVFYHAVKALNADEPPVRAAAARALARSGRADAAGYLAARLDDEWEVAAQSARALARLGPVGRTALEARAAGLPGLGRDLSRQLLWEGGASR